MDKLGILCQVVLLWVCMSAAWAHDPLIIAGELVAEGELVTLRLDIRQWALLTVLGRQDTLFASGADLAASRKNLVNYLLTHVSLQAGTQTVALAIADDPSTEHISDPLRWTLHGNLPPTAIDLTLRIAAFADLGQATSVIDSVQISGARTTATFANVRAGEAIVCTVAAVQEMPVAGTEAAMRAPPTGDAQFFEFMRLGFLHIVPEGLDHILFVLGLFLLAPQLKPLLTQVTAFTVAHSLTLGLAMAGVLVLPPRIVEPLIAVSIAVVAIENIFAGNRVRPWRWMIVFAFGLVHGLGFAGALREMPLAPGQFLLPLIGFNLGVEGGQFAVIAVAAAATFWAWKKSWYRQRIVIPVSALIACIGIFWAVQRALGFGIEA